jgi:HAD superfamily hydrolase (TIGR01549 family)
MKKKKGIIFDLDGTLVDSINFHMQIHFKVFKELGIIFDEEFFHKHCNGSSPKDFYKTILLHYKGNLDLYEQAYSLCEELDIVTDSTHIELFPHVYETLKELHEKGYKMVVASSSTRRYVKQFITQNRINEFFINITGGDEVKQTKPAPDIFLLAQEKLGLSKEECIIVEDAVQGVLAAKNAGIECICLLTTEKKEVIPPYAIIIKDHKELVKTIESL